MKVLLINKGQTPHQFGCTYTALKEVADSLNRNDITTEIYHIGAVPIRGCVGIRGAVSPRASVCSTMTESMRFPGD